MMLRNSCSCGCPLRASAVSEPTAARYTRGACAWIDRQLMVEIAEPQRAVPEHQLQLATLEHLAVLVAENRQQQLGVAAPP